MNSQLTLSSCLVAVLLACGSGAVPSPRTPLSATAPRALPSEVPQPTRIATREPPAHVLSTLPSGLRVLAIALPSATDATIALVTPGPLLAPGCTPRARQLMMASLPLAWGEQSAPEGPVLLGVEAQSSLEGIWLTASSDREGLVEALEELRHLFSVRPSSKSTSLARARVAARTPWLLGDDPRTYLISRVLPSSASSEDPSDFVEAEQLDACLRAMHSPGPTGVVVVSSLPASQVQATLAQALSAWPSVNLNATDRPSHSATFPTKARVQILPARRDRALLTVGMPGPHLTAPDYTAFKAVAHLLVASPVSRLQTRLRHDKGRTYAVLHQRDDYRQGSVHQILVDFEPELVNRVLRDTRAELEHATNHPTDAVGCERARQVLTAQLLQQLSEPAALAELGGRLLLQDLPFGSTIQGWNAQLEALTPATLQAAAARYFNPGHAIYLVSGPVIALEKQMQWGPLPYSTYGFEE